MSGVWKPLVPARRRCAALVLLAVALAGCNGAPVVRGDSEKNFRKSVEEIARRAPREKMDAFDRALRAIVLARAIGGEAERHSHFVSFTDTVSGAGAFMSPLQDWSTQRQSIVVKRIGRLIDGRTIDEIIKLGVREKAALDLRMERWTIRQSATDEVDWSQPQAPRRLVLDPADRGPLEEVSVSALVIVNTASHEGLRSALSFIVENRSAQSIRALALANRSALEAGESDPSDILHYVMPTPLAPGARRRIVTRAHMPDGFTKDAVIVGVETTAGQRMGMVPQMPRTPNPPLPISQVAVTETPLANLRAIAQ